MSVEPKSTIWDHSELSGALELSPLSPRTPTQIGQKHFDNFVLTSDRPNPGRKLTSPETSCGVLQIHWIPAGIRWQSFEKNSDSREI